MEEGVDERRGAATSEAYREGRLAQIGAAPPLRNRRILPGAPAAPPSEPFYPVTQYRRDDLQYMTAHELAQASLTASRRRISMPDTASDFRQSPVSLLPGFLGTCWDGEAVLQT
jgi:hypothetical protein